MSAHVVFESVSKRFHRGTRHGTLGGLLSALATGTARRAAAQREPFWALRDVTFAVGPGEALGIIGPNGSGKSTVLRLLAGILRADEGRVSVCGTAGRRPRLGALIETTAGFHYELTGRENVFLQGAVLGMPRAEITRRFDEIVDFAELSPFIDTPVKHYSSGMLARLGFAVAAHLDPDVLLIDEVLAVGDEAFQRKAFQRLAESVRRDVPTIVVSHQLHRVTELCNRAILLTRGRVLASGLPAECVDAYVGAPDPGPLATDSPVRLASLSRPDPPSVSPGERLRVRIQGEIMTAGAGATVCVGIRLRSLPREDLVLLVDHEGAGVTLPHLGAFALEIDLRMNVAPGTYRAQPVVWDRASRAELTRGHSVPICVSGTTLGKGAVFADPRFRLLDT